MEPRAPRRLPSDVQLQILQRWLTIAWRQRGAAVSGLTAALVAAGVVQLLADQWLSLDGASRWLLGLAHIPHQVIVGQWWRLLTSVWVHADPLHLMVNALMLWIIGRPVEAAYGSARLVVIWTGAVVVSGIAMLANPPLQATIGASGGVFGLLGALLGLGIKLLPRLDARLRWSMVGVPALCLAILIALGGPQADFAAHLGGAVGGLMLGVALRPQFLPLSRLARKRMAAGWVRGLAWSVMGMQALAIGAASVHLSRNLEVPEFAVETFLFDGVAVAYPAGTRRGTFKQRDGSCTGDLTDGAWALRTGRMPCWPLPLSGAVVVARREQLFSLDEGDWLAFRRSAETGRWVERQSGVLVAALPAGLVAVIFAQPPLLAGYQRALARLVPPAGTVDVAQVALPAAQTDAQGAAAAPPPAAPTLVELPGAMTAAQP